MKLAANISLMFAELPLLERISFAQSLGFTGIEVQFPYSETPQAWQQALSEAGLPVILFNLPAGDFMEGGDGLSCHPKRSKEFEAALTQATPYIDQLQPKTINILAGRQVKGMSFQDCFQQLVSNLQKACDFWQNHDLKITCEPINNQDQPGYLINTAASWQQLAEAVGKDNFALQLDIYHAARMRDDPLEIMQNFTQHLAHIQFADYPGRSHPGSGQLNWQQLLETLQQQDYPGWLAAEFKASTTDDFNWMNHFLLGKG